MNNYWDPSHYKRHIGNRVLDVVLGKNPPPSDSAFGRRVMLADIDRHLVSIRQDQSAWLGHPEQVARIKSTQVQKLPERNCRNAPGGA